MSGQLSALITRYKADPESVYNTWFVGAGERLKAFRSIRRGVRECVDHIAAGTFGNDFKGSPLEVVLTAITEQKQVFEGAAHPFYWKPKLRIPDIYEHEENKRKFGGFLAACLDATHEDRVLAEMSRLAGATIKGLGPAVASIVYFLHPTFVPPFNTAIVNGFNALFAEKKKLGSWTSYLEMRETIVRANETVRTELSKDLGAFAGLLFEIGAGRLVIDGNADTVLATENEKARKAALARHRDVVADQQEDSEHTPASCVSRISRARCRARARISIWWRRSRGKRRCSPSSRAPLFATTSPIFHSGICRRGNLPATVMRCAGSAATTPSCASSREARRQRSPSCHRERARLDGSGARHQAR